MFVKVLELHNILCYFLCEKYVILMAETEERHDIWVEFTEQN